MLPLRFVSVLFLLKVVQSKSVCTEDELNEAQRAFRNCVESAKAGIVSKHANEVDERLVCDSLENMLTGCDREVRCLFELMVCLNRKCFIIQKLLSFV